MEQPNNIKNSYKKVLVELSEKVRPICNIGACNFDKMKHYRDDDVWCYVISDSRLLSNLDRNYIEVGVMSKKVDRIDYNRIKKSTLFL